MISIVFQFDPSYSHFFRKRVDRSPKKSVFPVPSLHQLDKHDILVRVFCVWKLEFKFLFFRLRLILNQYGLPFETIRELWSLVLVEPDVESHH